MQYEKLILKRSSRKFRSSLKDLTGVIKSVSIQLCQKAANVGAMQNSLDMNSKAGVLWKVLCLVATNLASVRGGTPRRSSLNGFKAE